MALTPQQAARRRYLINRGDSGRDNPELDHLHKGITKDMTDGELLQTRNNRHNAEKGAKQVEAELRTRGYDV